ncbi:MAG TPA: ABC transporter substrate-binding protein [Novosphingobium sp.]|nr:ABC transporter substrate-binding protein [Novosphingobium sp.]
MLALGACSAPPPQEAPRPHPTIVSFNPCTDAILAEVAEPGQLLAISHYSQSASSSSMDLATARRFRSVSGTVEEVLALHPDVVVAGNFMSPATVGAMDGLGMRLEQLPIASTVADSEAQIRTLARLAGHPDRGAALIARIEAALAQAVPPPGTRPITTVVWQSGGMVPGDGTLIAELLRRTGFANFAAARGLGQADVLPLEAMLADPPALILATGDARANEDRLLAHPALAALKSTRRERLAPALLWCGGPTIIRAVERLAEVRRALRDASEPSTLRHAQGSVPLAPQDERSWKSSAHPEEGLSFSKTRLEGGAL